MPGKYGSVTVEWPVIDKYLSSDVPPRNVRVFYRKEKNHVTGRDRMVVVAYVHDREAHDVYFASTIHNDDGDAKASGFSCKTPGFSRKTQGVSRKTPGFSRKTHRRRALTRLMRHPQKAHIDPSEYSLFTCVAYTNDKGVFDWKRYAAKRPVNQICDGSAQCEKSQKPVWRHFDDIIRRKLHTIPNHVGTAQTNVYSLLYYFKGVSNEETEKPDPLHEIKSLQEVIQKPSLSPLIHVRANSIHEAMKMFHKATRPRVMIPHAFPVDDSCGVMCIPSDATSKLKEPVTADSEFPEAEY